MIIEYIVGWDIHSPLIVRYELKQLPKPTGFYLETGYKNPLIRPTINRKILKSNLRDDI